MLLKQAHATRFGLGGGDEGIPIEHRQHKAGQRVRDEHLA